MIIVIASLTYFRVKSGKMDAVIEQFKDHDIPAAKSRRAIAEFGCLLTMKQEKVLPYPFGIAKR